MTNCLTNWYGRNVGLIVVINHDERLPVADVRFYLLLQRFIVRNFTQYNIPFSLKIPS